MKALIVFYSRTGSTRKVAESIRESLDCDLEEVADLKSRSGLFGWLRSCFEAFRRKTGKIKDLEKDPSKYDLVLIGTPVWSGNVSPPIRACISKYRDKFRKVAFFCTCGDSSNKTFSDMEALCGKKPVALLEVREADVKRDNYKEKIEGYIKKIRS